LVGNGELNAVKGLLERPHHGEDHFLVIVFFDAREVQVRRKTTLAPCKHFAQTGAAFKGQSVQNAAVRQKLKQESQDDLLFRDRYVSQAGFVRITLYLRLREHS
jgi:hypothetical protein